MSQRRLPESSEPNLADFEASLQTILSSSNFSSALSERQWRVIRLDPVPEVDGNGVRHVEGWSMRIEAVVEENWVNNSGNVHGAAYAWIVDDATSAALLALHKEDFWGPPQLTGVSVSMNVEYFAPAIVGTELAVDVQVVKCSKRLAYLTCDITDRNTGKRYAKGAQWKSWRPPAGAAEKLGSRAKL